MHQQEIIAALSAIAPEIASSGDATGTLVKFATERDLAPAALERLTQMFNSAKTLSVMEKFSSDRGRKFQLVDPADVLEKYAAARTNKNSLAPRAAASKPVEYLTAAPKIHFDFNDRNIGGWSVAPIAKAASAVEEERHEAKLHRQKGERRALEKLAKEIEFLSEFAYGCAERTEAKFASFAQGVRRDYDFDGAHFARLEEDFLDLAQGPELLKKAFIGVVAGRFAALRPNGTVARAAGQTKRAFAIDRTRHAAVLVEAFSSLLDHESAKAVRSEKRAQLLNGIKAAGFTNLGDLLDAAKARAEEEQAQSPRGSGKNPNTLQMPGGKEDLDKVDTGGKEQPPGLPGVPSSMKPADRSVTLPDSARQSGDIGATASAVLDGLGKALQGGGQAGGALVNDLFAGKAPLTDAAAGLAGDSAMDTAKKTDKALYRDRVSTSLQRLMLTDPVISKAEPAEVTSFTETILAHAPSLAQDPNTLRIYLREAIQYGAVPLHTLKELGEVEKNIETTADTRGKNHDRRYGSGAAAPAK